MDLANLKALVSDGRFFGVKFIKRTDGSVRTMCARTGVVPKEAGEYRSWDPADKGLLQVWDAHKKGYRLIPADSILELSVRGQKIVP